MSSPSSSSSSSAGKSHKDYSMVVSASSLGAMLVVSGFCWFFYYVCKPRKPARARRTSLTSVIAHGGVPGDPHGHYDVSRQRGIYLDSGMPGMDGTGIRNSNLLHPLGGLDVRRISLPNCVEDVMEEKPPGYPGLLAQVVSRPHSPAESTLPPPYSAT